MLVRCLGCMAEFSSSYDVCPHCGYVVGTPAEEAIHLSPGSRLHNRFLVGKVLGYGGFGVTYIGWDELLEQKVAIKEYLPSEFSTRMPGQTQITVFNGDKKEQFHDGLTKFVDEAKRLAKFQHEDGIVQIFDSFEENNTAYIVMEYLEGETLADYLGREGVLEEDKAVAILLPVMEALKSVHAEGILHRDIAPDNIFLTNDGKVKLIDFGASRYATTSHSRSLTVLIKPGYSPEEQYRSRGDQGPYTDVYALSAVLYKMLTGKTPPDAMERRAKYEGESKDILVEPHKLNKKITLNRENAILNALNVRIEDRTQDIDQFIEELQADPPVKRRYGKIKKIDVLRWPKWAKITVPVVIVFFAVIGILIATGVIDFNKFTQKITIPEGVVVVPEVEGMASAEAIKEIENGQLLAVTAGTVESEYIEAGTIVLQSPIGGSYADMMSKVMLTVSSGGEVKEAVDGISTVPYVVWDSLEDAKEKLKTAGLGEPETSEEYDDNVEEGHVISQSIAAGEEVEEGSIIKLVISKGPAPFAMPNVTGQQRQRAIDTLSSLGLTVTIEYETNNSATEDSVLRQSISQGTNVKRGETVILTVANRSETVTVPNVTGMSQTNAVRTLEGQGFSVNVLYNYSDTVANGNVISQTPAGGTSQVRGASVTIYVSQGKQPSSSASGGTTPQPTTTPINTTVTVPDVFGKTKSEATNMLLALGLKVQTEEVYVSSDMLKQGNVISQEPKAGAIVEKDSLVILQISKGQKELTVTLDPNGGTVSPTSKVVRENGMMGTLPTPERTGMTFKGWMYSNGSYAYSEDKITESGDFTLTALWDYSFYTLYFDPNGGAVSPTSMSVQYNFNYGELPTPIRDNYIFDGWYTDPNGGELITVNSYHSIADNRTIYAHWTPLKSQLSCNITSCYFYEAEGDWAGTWWLHFECSVNSNYKLITLALNIDGINRDYRSCADQNTVSTVYWGNIAPDIEPPSIGPHTISVIATDESGNSVQSDIVITYSGE